MKLPDISAKKLIKLLTQHGFVVVRRKGSHVSLHKKINERNYLVIVPIKNSIKKGTLLSIIKQANLTRNEFLDLLDKL